jgi:hypothetical protein
VPADVNGDSLHFMGGVYGSDILSTYTPFSSRTDVTGFSPLPPVTEGLGTMSYTLQDQDVLIEGEWWWRVQAWDGYIWGTISEEGFFIIDLTKPKTSGHNPSAGATEVPLATDIIVHVQDALSGVDSSSVELQVNGELVIPTMSGTSSEYTVRYNPEQDFGYGETVVVTIDAKDLAGNTIGVEEYSFTTVGPPREYRLAANYPNPFHEQTRMKYTVAHDGEVQIVVYNVLGQEIRRLVSEPKNVGEYEILWDGRDTLGERVVSGIYLVRMEAGDFSAVRKMILWNSEVWR